MKTSKIRHQFYLSADLSAKLDALAARPGASKTSIMTDALKGWTERQARHELDTRFGPRLDRQSRISERIERKLEMATEVLGVFVQHQLTLVAHQPQFDAETGRLGQERYQRLLALVERRIASGKGRVLVAGDASAEDGHEYEQ
jgi:predicted transcriptional regulator